MQYRISHPITKLSIFIICFGILNAFPLSTYLNKKLQVMLRVFILLKINHSLSHVFLHHIIQFQKLNLSLRE